MKNVKHAKCVKCGKIYEAVPNLTNCSCGGILEVVYDYDYIKTVLTKQTLAARADRSMWRYRELLPIEESTENTPLRVGWSPLYEEPRLAELLGLGRLWVKDDGQNPTASLKDRASAMAVAKAREAEKLTRAARYERNEARQGYRSGRCGRNFTTTSGDVTLRVPRLKGASFETAIIERYRRRESGAEEELIEMYPAGVSARRVRDITEALWGSKVSPATISELNKKACSTLRIGAAGPYRAGAVRMCTRTGSVFVGTGAESSRMRRFWW